MDTLEYLQKIFDCIIEDRINDIPAVGELNSKNNEKDDQLSTLLKQIDELISANGFIYNPVLYHSLCKYAARNFINEDLIHDAIFYLTEAHGAYQRAMYYRRFECPYIETHFEKTEVEDHLNIDLLSCHGSFNKPKFDGLMNRLREMPEEWTIVQITSPANAIERWTPRSVNEVFDLEGLHIVRFNCGEKASSCHYFIPSESDINDNDNVLKCINQTMLTKHSHIRSNVQTRAHREKQCELLKRLVNEEITPQLLMPWQFLLLGRIQDSKLEKSINQCINRILSKCELSSNDESLLRSLVMGCTYLDDIEIDDVVGTIVKNKKYLPEITEQILKLKFDHEKSLRVKRHPVILILDEKVECIPWETLPVLKTHPVSRMISIHFAHAIFKANSDSIIKGNKIIQDIESGYYIINPENDLPDTEKKMKSLIDKYIPKWQGIAGTSPTKIDVMEALKNKQILMYCGHGNGAVYISSSKLTTTTIKAVTLLFGCSSVERKDFGARYSCTNYADSLLIAGSPCVVGMLWSVTSHDTDEMSSSFIRKCFSMSSTSTYLYGKKESDVREPEILRAAIEARDSGQLYSNKCALVCYGLPVICEYK